MEARELPGGTVTFLFTDMEGSTRLLQELGRDAYVRALTDHRRLLRETVAAHRGVEVELQGDSFHFAFARAEDAVAAAVAAQRVLHGHDWESEPVRVRMGLHTGEPLQADGLYAGLDVHWAARVMAAGHGGQVLVSARTADLVADQLPEGATLLHLGQHRLKDLTAPQRLHQVAIAGLQVEFPPLKALHVTSLPVQPNRLIGRRVELTEIVRRLGDGETRLLTLLGPGGTGKTRLALQAAADLTGRFEGGVYFVPLASVQDADLLLPEVARALGLRAEGSQTVTELLDEQLAQKRLLLVLDNLEQIVEAAPPVSALLTLAPHAALLVTSREPLRVGGEQRFAVSGLPLSGEGLDSDAVALFVERARAASHAFELSDDNAAAVASICRLLDGLPLALELAAARVAVLPPQAIVERLDRSLDLLTRGPRDVDERQRALRSTIGWSYDLLRESERRAFARLSVFPAGFSIDSAEEVCEASLEDLTGLAEQSLLRRELVAGAAAGFRFLRVIREYALEQLAARDDADETRRRHAEWCLDLAKQADAGYRGDDAAEWLERAEAHHEDFRAALVWAASAGERALLLELAVALSVLWQAHGHLSEAASWFEAVLARPAELEKERLLDALNEASTIAHRAGEYDRAAAYAERQLELSRELALPRGTVYALAKLSSLAVQRGDHERARTLDAEAVAVAREAADDRALMTALTSLGNLELLAGQFATAAQLFREALELVRSAGRRDSLATALFNIGLASVLAGSADEASTLLGQSLQLAHELGDREGVAYALSALAAVAAGEGDAREAAVRLGAAEALLEACGASLESVERALHDRTRDEARAALGEEFEETRREGGELSTETLVERLAEVSRR